MATTTQMTTTTDAGRRVFTRVVAGVDGSPEGLEAARQATILTDAGGELTLLAAWTLAPPLIAPTAGAAYAMDEERPRRDADDALRAAYEHAGGAAPHCKLVRGFPWQSLSDECAREHATIVAVGSHGQGRAYGILSGSTTTELIHKAPCSVLVARKAGDDFPRKIVVGIDGSPESAEAYTAAAYLAERFGAELWPVVAHGGNGVDKALVAKIVDHHHEDLPDEPVRALVAAAADADLVVVGSRGLHGLKALGSVSERVGHEAHCSVLIVRRPPW